MSIKQNFPAIRPTLNLDFANSKTVDSRITFTRASGATYTDVQGTIQILRDNKPRIDFDPNTGECRGLLIEEQRANLLSNSSDIVANSNWSLNNCLRPVRASVVSPSGLMDAYKIMENSANTRHETNFVGFSVTNGNTYVATVYAKAAERSFLELAFGGYPSASFNLTTGVAVANGTQVSGYPKMTAVGNGWYRCEFAWLCTGDNANMSLYMGIEQAAGGYVVNQGSFGYGLYIWGAQVEVGTFSTSYIPTTTVFGGRTSSATYYDKNGILRTAPINGPRYGYAYDTASAKWVAQGLIVEAAGTNLINNYNSNLYADYFSAEAKWTSIVASSTDVTAPDGSAYTTKAVSGTTGNSFFWRYSPVSYSQNTTYTHSVWIRCGAGQGTATISLSTLYQNKVVTVTEQWQRFEVSFDTGTLASGTPYTSVVGPENNKTFYFWGWQVEQGTVATSYIPTYGAAATRSADSTTSAATTRAAENALLDVSGIYTKDGVSVFGEAESFANNAGRIVAFAPNTADSSNVLSVNYETGYFRTYQYTDSALRFNTAGAGYITNNYQKFAMGVSNNAFSTAVNAYKESGAGVTVYQMNSMRIGSMNTGQYYLSGHIKKLGLYPKKLTDTQLIALTV